MSKASYSLDDLEDAAAAFRARHKATPEIAKQRFKDIFWVDEVDLPPSLSATRPLSHHAFQQLIEDVGEVTYDDDLRMADAPHTCVHCAMRFADSMYAPLCVWEMRDGVQSCVYCTLREFKCCSIPDFFGDNILPAFTLCDVVQASYPAMGFGRVLGPFELGWTLIPRYERCLEDFRRAKFDHDRNRQQKNDEQKNDESDHDAEPQDISDDDESSLTKKRKRSLNNIWTGSAHARSFGPQRDAA